MAVVRFVLHPSGSLRGIKIDWEAPVEVSPAMRQAMAPAELDDMKAGVLLRGYAVGKVTYARGAVAFRVAVGHEVFLQLPTEDAPAVTAAPVEPQVTWTVESEAAGDRHRIVVDKKHDGERADVIVAGLIPNLSRAVAQRLIDGGHVTLAGQPVKKSNQRLRAGDVLEALVARPYDA